MRSLAFTDPPHDLDAAGDPDRDRKCDQEPLEGAVLEGLAAEVAEQARVRAPDHAGGDVKLDESDPLPVEAAAGESHRRAAGGDEPRDHDQVAAAFLDHLVCAVEMPPARPAE